VSPAAQAASNFRWSYQLRFQRGFRGSAAFRNLANCFGIESGFASGRQINRIWESVKYILAFPDRLLSGSPIHRAAPSQQHQGGLFAFGVHLVGFSRQQTSDRKAHPLPLDFGSRKMQEFAAFLRGQRLGMQKKFACAHLSLRMEPGDSAKNLTGTDSSNRFDKYGKC